MLETFRGWLALADERLAGSDVRCFVMPGNDDPASIEAVIGSATYVESCDEKVVEFDQLPDAVAGLLQSHPLGLPPRARRERPVRADRRRWRSRSRTTTRAVWNIHVPPHDSQLDTAAELDEDFNMVLVGRQPHMIPVGSSAVREAIERYQPLATLHGHIHESAGATRIGRTLCINPGSDYHTGRIAGCLVNLRGDRGQSPVRHRLARVCACPAEPSRSRDAAGRLAALAGPRAAGAALAGVAAPVRRRPALPLRDPQRGGAGGATRRARGGRPARSRGSTASRRARGSCCCPTTSWRSWPQIGRERERRGVPVPRPAGSLGRRRPGPGHGGGGRGGARGRGDRGVRGRSATSLRPRDPQHPGRRHRRAGRAGPPARAGRAAGRADPQDLRDPVRGQPGHGRAARPARRRHHQRGHRSRGGHARRHARGDREAARCLRRGARRHGWVRPQLPGART